MFWVDALPKTASGKIQKFKLKEMAVDLLLAVEQSMVQGGGPVSGAGGL